MTIASDNAFPSILATEGSVPASPAAGKQRIYIDTADHKLKRVDSSGTVTVIEGAAGGSVATDAIWDAAGDLAVGSGADTAARLAKGNAGGVLAMGNSAVIWNAGTSFPGSKATGDRYWRTDLGMEFYWDGTRWVSTTLYTMQLNGTGATLSASGTFGSCGIWEPTYAVWLVDFRVSGYIGATNTGSAYWGFEFRRISDDTSLAAALNTSAASANGMWAGVSAIGAVSTDLGFYTAAIKTSSPSNFAPQAFVTYRIIAT